MGVLKMNIDFSCKLDYITDVKIRKISVEDLRMLFRDPEGGFISLGGEMSLKLTNFMRHYNAFELRLSKHSCAAISALEADDDVALEIMASGLNDRIMKEMDLNRWEYVEYDCHWSIKPSSYYRD